MRKLGSFIFFIFILILILINIETVHAQTGNVTIYYNDINQHPVGQKISHTTCTVGTTYKASAPTISGYTLDVNASETSTYCDEGENILAFVYQTNGNKKEGTVKVSCYDTNGNKLSKCTDGRSGTPGAEYYINPPTIDGYKFVKVEGPNNGKFVEGSVTVKFIYESVGGNLVEEKIDEKPTAEVKEEVKEETKQEVKQEPVKTSQTSNNTVVTKKIVTKTNTVKSSSNNKVEETKKEEVKEEVKEETKENKNIEKSITIVDHTKNNTSKYIAIGGIFSSIVLIGFIIKYSLFK